MSLFTRNRATREMYENHIANLEKNCAQSAQEIVELHEEIKKYKNLMNEQLHNSTSTEDNLIYNEKIEELTILLNNERKKQEQFEERFAHTERQCQEFEDILKVSMSMYDLYLLTIMETLSRIYV